MSPTQDLQPEGEKMRNALRWICEILKTYPGKTRQQVIREAEIRFDLSPRECAFLDQELCREEQP